MKIKLSLLENAYEFLENSLHDFGLVTDIDSDSGYKRYWKFALVDLVQSMELMFKEVLRRENELFIYENIDNPSKTVSASIALKRLKRILNIELSPKDEKTIQKAIEIRNQIIHFEVELNLNQLANIYIIIFEFLHSFHYKYLNEELHDNIHPSYWEQEARLIERFKKSDLVIYGGVQVSKYYPIDIAESQLYPTFTVEDIEYPRIKFGKETEEDNVYRKSHCGDCSVKQGYYHALGCDLEVCPKCGGQAVSCDCDLYKEFLIEE